MFKIVITLVFCWCVLGAHGSYVAVGHTLEVILRHCSGADAKNHATVCSPHGEEKATSLSDLRSSSNHIAYVSTQPL